MPGCTGARTQERKTRHFHLNGNTVLLLKRKRSDHILATSAIFEKFTDYLFDSTFELRCLCLQAFLMGYVLLTGNGLSC